MRQIISGLLIFLLGLGLVFCKKKQDWEIIYPSAPIFSVKGFVYDDHNKMPIEGMKINLTVVDSVYGTCSSNSLGYFEIDSLYSEKFKKIDYMVDFYKEGYSHSIHDIAVVQNSVNMGDIYFPRAFKIIEEYNTPGYDISGIAWDGNNIWTCDASLGNIYKHDNNLNVIEEYQDIIDNPTAMAFIDSSLWIGNKKNFYLYALDKDLSIIDSIQIKFMVEDEKGGPDYEFASRDITFKDGILISCENIGAEIRTINIQTLEENSFHMSGFYDPNGLVWIGDYFFIKFSNGIYKVTANFESIAYFVSPIDGITQLTYDGNYFYAAVNVGTSCRIYKFENVHK